MGELILIVLMYGGGYALAIVLLLAASFSKVRHIGFLGLAFAFLLVQNGCAFMGTRLPSFGGESHDVFWKMIAVSTALFIVWLALLLKLKK